jgi:hypothetical protein
MLGCVAAQIDRVGLGVVEGITFWKFLAGPVPVQLDQSAVRSRELDFGEHEFRLGESAAQSGLRPGISQIPKPERFELRVDGGHLFGGADQIDIEGFARGQIAVEMAGQPHPFYRLAAEAAAFERREQLILGLPQHQVPGENRARPAFPVGTLKFSDARLGPPQTLEHGRKYADTLSFEKNSLPFRPVEE